MEKRVFLAIFLSFVVLAVYQMLLPPPLPPPAVTLPANVPGAAPGAAGAPAAAPVDTAAPTATVPAPLEADTEARDIVVETNHVRAVFSNVGATLHSWKLKNYLENGQPLELIAQDMPANLPRPFTLSTNDEELSRRLATARFSPSAQGGLVLGPAAGTLNFSYRDASGLTARKTFYFQPEGKPYVMKVEASVDVGGASRPVTLTSGPALGPGYSTDGSTFLSPRAITWVQGSIERLAGTSIEGSSQHEGELKFAGVEDQYFLAAVLPGTERAKVEYRPIVLPVPGAEAGTTRTLVSFQVSVPGPLALPYFIGPKDFDVLRDVDPKLELVRAIDFGRFFAWIVVPLLQALKWINGYVHNYGWSSVVLTILINLAIFPLRHRSMVSMRKMQALQPEIKAMQERYKKYKITDPERQKMNTEMMALYKQKGVNPASGCVPMLLTLPVLFAFYSMLSAAIELRNAPWLGWITDLSRHDPLYITPVLMGATMFWQQKMMPTTADPLQQKIFLFMPLIFTFSFLWVPSGLVLYWLMSNIMAIGQQYVTNRLIAAPTRPPRQVKAAALAGQAGSNGKKKN
jgi:YidC/Oxa1 family membrane protein insertase